MCETYKDIAEQEPLPINLLLTLTQLKTHGDLTLVWKLNINPYALKSFLYIRSLMLAASLGRMNTEVLVSTVLRREVPHFFEQITSCLYGLNTSLWFENQSFYIAFSLISFFLTFPISVVLNSPLPIHYKEKKIPHSSLFLSLAM